VTFSAYLDFSNRKAFIDSDSETPAPSRPTSTMRLLWTRLI